uniref:Uncharacterized protein n=1 Tax=Arundo donax TaxID=35708 RepID=A0A0A9E5N9_ARUDO
MNQYPAIRFRTDQFLRITWPPCHEHAAFCLVSCMTF